MKKVLLLLSFISSTTWVFGQAPIKNRETIRERQEVQLNSAIQEDSITIDSLVIEESKRSFNTPKVFTRDFYKYKNGYPNPKASLFLSFALPGTGQIYNKKTWKAPIIYAGMGGMIYFLDDSSTKYVAYRNAYKRSISEGSSTFQSPLIEPNLSSAALKIQRDKYEKRRTLSYIGTVAVYGLFALEAFVDAHLQSFDISKDLSLDLKPSIQEHYSLPGLGIVLSVK